MVISATRVDDLLGPIGLRAQSRASTQGPGNWTKRRGIWIYKGNEMKMEQEKKKKRKIREIETAPVILIRGENGSRFSCSLEAYIHFFFSLEPLPMELPIVLY